MAGNTQKMLNDCKIYLEQSWDGSSRSVQGIVRAAYLAGCREQVENNSDILKALDTLYTSFQHIKGNTKGNKAKTDIIKFNDDVRVALNTAYQILNFNFLQNKEIPAK